jgi:hypothetical protein
MVVNIPFILGFIDIIPSILPTLPLHQTCTLCAIICVSLLAHQGFGRQIGEYTITRPKDDLIALQEHLLQFAIAVRLRVFKLHINWHFTDSEVPHPLDGKQSLQFGPLFAISATVHYKNSARNNDSLI